MIFTLVSSIEHQVWAVHFFFTMEAQAVPYCGMTSEYQQAPLVLVPFVQQPGQQPSNGEQQLTGSPAKVLGDSFLLQNIQI